jgi:RNA polymerase sigma factor (TIGR02999 family)
MTSPTHAAHDGEPDPSATASSGGGPLDEVFPEAFEELKRVAHRRLSAEPAGHTLDTTALVNETWDRMASQRNDRFANRGHFFAQAATAMRRILVDYARRHMARKRSGHLQQVSLADLESSQAELASPSAEALLERAELLIALDAALERLREVDAQAASVVDCRYFGGIPDREIAAALGVTERTVGRAWVRARVWLRVQLATWQ